MNKTTIVIVEDDEITSLNLSMSLQKQGYSVVGICHDTLSAKHKISTSNPDIVIVDISLDESNDGIELARVINKEYKIPFIYLTSYSDENIISQAKETEPYGYILKPFEPNALHASIQMALFKFSQENRHQEHINSSKLDKDNIEKLLLAKCSPEKSIITFAGGYHLDIVHSETYYQGEKIKLTRKENAFIRLLIAKLGSVVSFEQAMSYVWEEEGASQNSVRTLVWRLRNKLKTDIIQNSSGLGYSIES
ncbi:MAG: response regulator [Sulfurimonas sp.]|nr:response regulator [Sulfurimonas sp.]